jgi:hypothetical protein
LLETLTADPTNRLAGKTRAGAQVCRRRERRRVEYRRHAMQSAAGTSRRRQRRQTVGPA